MTDVHTLSSSCRCDRGKSPSTALTDTVPIQLIRKLQRAPAGPPLIRPVTDVSRMPSQDNKAEHENPRMDMNPKLRFSSGLLPSRARCASSLGVLLKPPLISVVLNISTDLNTSTDFGVYIVRNSTDESMTKSDGLGATVEYPGSVLKSWRKIASQDGL